MAWDSDLRHRIIAYEDPFPGPTGSYLIISSTPEVDESLRHEARRLTRAGHRVRWTVATRRGVANPDLPGFRRLNPARASSRAHALSTGALAQVAGARRRTVLAAKFDPWFRQAVRSVRTVIATDEAAAAALPIAAHFAPGVRRYGPVLAAQMITEQVGWDALASALPAVLTAKARQLRQDENLTQPLVRALQELPGSGRLAQIDPQAAYELLSHLARSGASAVVAQIANALRPAPGMYAGDPVLTGFAALAELDQTTTTPDLMATVRGVLSVADDHLGAGNMDSVAITATLALDLLFHRELHSDVSHSELVEDPEGYLQVLRDSAVGALLTSPTAPRAEPAAHPRKTVRATVLRGAYGNTHQPVAEALQQAPRTEVSVLDLSTKHHTFRTMTTDPQFIRLRLDHAQGRKAPDLAGIRSVLQNTEAVMANWADKGAMLASLHLPSGSRLTVKVHSVDALRPWLHLIDWARVDHLICVSPHIADLVQEMLGNRLQHTRTHVVPNIIHTDRFDVDKPVESRRVLCMVGWAQRVKDPLWALEVLSRLRAVDPGWRLLLIGADFAANPSVSGRAYAEQFRRRAMADDLREHIEYVGYTDDLPAQVQRAGFALSTSVRESWPVGVMEAAAAGAVPVIRDWPMFATRGAARRLYPPQWVVTTPEQAARRILDIASSQDRWQTESEYARATARTMADAPALARDYRRIILGEHAELADLVHTGQDERAIEMIQQVLDRPQVPQVLLRQANDAARLLGEISLRFAVLDRLAEQNPNPRVLSRMRQVLGALRETEPGWLPAASGSGPIDPVPGRILHVLKASVPHRQSGYAVRSMYTLQGQQDLGMYPEAVTPLDFPGGAAPRSPQVEEVGGVTYRRLLREHIPAEEPVDAYLDQWAARLTSLAAQMRPQVIHAHSGHRGYESALVALSVGKAIGRPVVYEVRGFFESLWGASSGRAERGEIYERRRATEERCMRAAAAVVTLSESMRSDIIDRGIDPDRVHVVPNAVDASALPPRRRSPELLDRWGLSGRFVFGYVSNLDHIREGHELLIEAAVALREQGVPATALIVGDGERAELLRAHADQLGAGDSVVFTGQIPHSEVLDYYALCDVFVVPRIDDRAARLVTPLKPYEAMALQVPLLVSDLPALAEVIGDGQRGRTFRAGSVDSLVEALLSARAEPERQARMAARARQWVTTERTWARNARAYQDIYDSVAHVPPDWPQGPDHTEDPEHDGLVAQVAALQEQVLHEQALQEQVAAPARHGTTHDDGAVPGGEDVAGLRWRRHVLRAALASASDNAQDEEDAT